MTDSQQWEQQHAGTPLPGSATTVNGGQYTRQDETDAGGPAAGLPEFEDYERLLESYEQALRQNPGDVLAYTGKGNILLHLLRPVEALEAYTRALQHDPHFVAAVCGKAMALRLMERYKEALAAYEQAIQIDKTFLPAYWGRAFTLLHLGHTGRAFVGYLRVFHAEAFKRKGN